VVYSKNRNQNMPILPALDNSAILTWRDVVDRLWRRRTGHYRIYHWIGYPKPWRSKGNEVLVWVCWSSTKKIANGRAHGCMFDDSTEVEAQCIIPPAMAKVLRTLIADQFFKFPEEHTEPMVLCKGFTPPYRVRLTSCVTPKCVWPGI